MKKLVTKIAALLLVPGLLLSACGGSQGSTPASSPSGNSQNPVTIEFAQWWDNELPEGYLQTLIDKFEEQNPNIKVEMISAPYASIQEQLVAGAATGTMADVVGLSGGWVNDFVQQGAIANLTELMQQAGYDDSQLASQCQINGATYMIPVVTFVYALYTNTNLLTAAGISEVPRTRSEFIATAKAMTNASSNTYGWALPLSLEAPNGVQNDVMTWAWASGESALKDGMPDLTNEGIQKTIEFVKELYYSGSVSPGVFSMKEQDKVEEFCSGRVGMIVSPMGHINTIKTTNPELNFSVSSIPVEDGFDGERGVPFSMWGIGVSENSEHKEEAWKLIEFLMSPDANSELCTNAKAFPGNLNAKPGFVDDDELFASAFEIYKNGRLKNEFIGMPVATELMRVFDEQMQLMLENEQSVEQMLENAQNEWVERFK